MNQIMNMELSRDQVILELIALLKQNQRKETANDVFEMSVYIDIMEKKLDTVMDELVTVKKQLVEMQERQERKSLKEALSKAAEHLEQQCQYMKQQLFGIKAEVKLKATEIVKGVKQKGKRVLNKVSESLDIKDKLKHLRQNIQNSMVDVDKTIIKIDTFGRGMREAVAQGVTTIRTFVNKPEKEEERKQFSKTELLKQPFQKKRMLLEGILKYTESAITKCEKLSQDTKQQNKGIEKLYLENMDNPEVRSQVSEQQCLYGANIFEENQLKKSKAPIMHVERANTFTKSEKMR